MWTRKKRYLYELTNRMVYRVAAHLEIVSGNQEKLRYCFQRLSNLFWPPLFFGKAQRIYHKKLSWPKTNKARHFKFSLLIKTSLHSPHISPYFLEQFIDYPTGIVLIENQLNLILDFLILNSFFRTLWWVSRNYLPYCETFGETLCLNLIYWTWCKSKVFNLAMHK